MPKVDLEKIEKEQAEAKLVNRELKSGSQVDDETRQTVAKKFVNYYFGLLALIIIGVPLYNYLMYKVAGSPALIISIKDAILTYSAVAGPTFGLVVAYYFKSKND